MTCPVCGCSEYPTCSTCAELRADLAASQREADRLRHGEATAEDGVCTDAVEVVRLREEVARLQGDRCDVCDEDGLIYTSDLCDVGEWEDGERPEACPACGGTRSGFASRMRAEAERLRKIFDDAGQGEHNVLALVDHYQDEAIKATAEVDRCRGLIAAIMEGDFADGEGGHQDATFNTDYREGVDALRYLAEIGRVEIVSEQGRRVIARWK